MEELIYKPTSEQVARALLNSGSYLIKDTASLLDKTQWFKWKSGILAPVYTNCRLLMGNPYATAVVIQSLMNSIKYNFPGVELIVGVEASGIQWSSTVASELELPTAFVRKKAKEYGADEGRFVGSSSKLENVTAILIDDLVASGESLEEAIEVLQKEKHIKVIGVQSIVNWNFKHMKERFERLQIPIKALVSYPQILNEAVNQGIIDSDIKNEFLNFYQNPKGYTCNFQFLINRISKPGERDLRINLFDEKSKVPIEAEKKIATSVFSSKANIHINKVIGLIIPDSNNPYFTSIAFEFVKEFERQGWHLLIANSDNSDSNPSRELEIIEHFKRLGISGLIYINGGNQTDELYSSLIANHHDLPVLSFDRPLDNRFFDYVVIDSKKGTLESIDYLFTKGHQKIAYLKGISGTLTARQRYEAYKEAMAVNRINIDEKLVFEGDYQFYSGVECAEMLIEMGKDKRPTAIICANDLMAIGLMQRLQKAGWKLPEQLSVIGFDDIPMSKWVYPALTTIAQPVETLVTKASSILLRRINAERNNIEISQQKEIITPTLVLRESVSNLMIEEK